MKQRNVILTMIFASLFAKGAAAADVELRVGSVYDAKDAEKIEEANVLLKRLAELGALDIDENQNIHVKKSVLDKLKEQGRVQEIQARAGSICD